MLIFLLVAGVFLPGLRHDFIYYDDPGFVLDNPHVRDGLTWANVKWAFLSPGVDYWRPLSWLSHMADCQIYGLNPWGHHLSSILLHALNSLLVFVVLRKLTGAVWRSLLVAALFGLHPMHVESVAWIAERKDVLSTSCWLLTLWAYAHWVSRRAARQPRASAFYGLALAFFVLGLMSKPMLVTVPCVLLLLDFWPLGRFGGIPANPRAGWRWSLLIEKIPFFVLAVAVGVFTVVAQKQIGALKTAEVFPWPDRVANALIAYCRYLGKCAVPCRLAVFYPNPPDQPVGWAVLAGVLLVGITIVAVGLCRRRAYLLVGWLWFLGTLVPVIGLVQVGEQSMADRYSYMPLGGIFVVLAWALGDLAARWPRRSGLLVSTTGLALVSCTILTSRQLGFWQDSKTLFRHALAVTEDNWAAHVYLGFALAKSPEHLSEAIAEFEAGLQIAPNVSEAHNYLANALARRPGREAEAIAEFKTALRLNPKLADAHNNLATILARSPGRLPEAIAEYQAAVELRPDSAEMHLNLGVTLARLPERLPEAVRELRTALSLEPDSAEAHCDLAGALAETPDQAGAAAEYRRAVQLKPDHVAAHLGLGLVLAKMPGRAPEAVAECQAALRLQPGDPNIHNALGNAWTEIPGRLPDAITEFRTALRLQPDLVEVHNNIGFALAQMPGRLTEAIAEYEAVLRARPDFAEAHFNLGNALAGTPGRKSEAIAEYETAIRINPGYVPAHFNLALLLADVPGEISRAIGEYETVVRAQPELAEAHYNLGLLLANVPGRRSEAIGHFTSALQIKPDFAPARAMLDQLRAAP